MPVISVRVAEEDLAFLKERHENISEVVRRALHEEIRWRRLQENLQYLDSVRIDASRPAEETIREERDAR